MVKLTCRRTAKFAWHALAVSAACVAAFHLRFEFDIPVEERYILPYSVMLVLAVMLPLFSFFGLYRGVWRYTGMSDLRRITASAAIGSLAFFALVRLALGCIAFPRSIYFLNGLLIAVMVGGGRFLYRSIFELCRKSKSPAKRVLVIGAGDAGEMIVRDMLNNPDRLYEPVGFVDDDFRKKGMTIHGVPILGARRDIREIIWTGRPEEILLAIPSAKPATLNGLIRDLSEFSLPIKTLPNLKDVMDGRVSIGQIKKLELEDLLDRAPVKTDDGKLTGFIKGKSVLVTGAGGSIGSEICRQAADYGAKCVVAFERHENSLYNLEMDFRRNRPGASLYPFAGDINDPQRVEEALESHLPDIVFHAAAHKHVPMMEQNPREAIKNNVLGTFKMALLSGRYGVGSFVLISTDKAVNPTSVMGASKRACEYIIRALSESGSTKYITVRFGNVLGSSGSVVPLFREQIKRGGPVTVTHPEISRFLMLIPEAVQLVLQAASAGMGGELFVLDMGEPIKIADLARNMITLSGLEPEKDIKIEYIGLRPGEKLYEELFDKNETAITCMHKVYRALSSGMPDRQAIIRFAYEMEHYINAKDTRRSIELLSRLVKTYKPRHAYHPKYGLTGEGRRFDIRPTAA